MQRSPPEHRIMDDGEVDRSNEAIDRGDTPLSATLTLRRGQSDVAEVEEEQDEHRCQSPVPLPPGAPGRPSPNRAGDQADCREGCPRGSNRTARNRRQRMPPDELADRC